MHRTSLSKALLLCACLPAFLACARAAHADGDARAFLETLRRVGAEGDGNASAAGAWRSFVSSASPSALPVLLAGLDGADAVRANWIRSAVDAIAGRSRAKGEALPLKALEAFLADRSHDPRARRLAYELLVAANEAVRERLVDGFLDDPSVELRREAVARVLARADAAKEVDRSDAPGIYRRALDAARDLDQIQSAAGSLRELGEAVDLPRHFGFLMKWKITGPFDNSDAKGFDVAYPPEKSIDLGATFTGKVIDGTPSSFGWKEHSTDDELGKVDLNRGIRELKGAAAYAYAEFVSLEARDVEFRIASVNAFKLWVNGEPRYARNEYHHGTQIDHYRAPAKLVKGRNRILLKVCQNEQTQDWAKHWRFQIRVCDSTGTAILSADRKDGEQ